MIDNEKPLVLTEREFKQLVEVIVDNKFLEYIDYFRAEQEKSIQMTQQNQEYREQQVKQAKIDVLNKLKSSAVYDDNYLDGYVFIDDVNKLIEEVEHGEDKGCNRSRSAKLQVLCA